MIFVVLIAFLVTPIVEIAIFIEAGKLLGLGWTLALVVITAIAGTALLRRQGLQTLRRVQTQLDQGTLPVGEVFSGLCLLVAGALLLTPGFATDALGFALMVPAVRDVLIGFILRRILSSRHTHIWVDGQPVGDQRGGDHPGSGRDGPIIDGEFKEVKPDEPPADDRSIRPPAGPRS